MSPSAVNSRAEGEIVTAPTSWATSTSTVSATEPDIAVTAASPLPAERTSPVESTVATDAFPDTHEKAAPSTGWPFASNASALRRRVSPSAVNSRAECEIVTAPTSWATVTLALPDTEPAVAVIVASPFATAVTSPDAPTVPTAELLLAQVTVTPVIACPFWSRTSAVICTVPPKAVSSAVAGRTVTVVARGGSTPSSHDKTHTTATAQRHPMETSTPLRTVR